MKDVELSWELLKKYWRPIGVVMIILITVAIYWVRGYLLAVKAEKAYYNNGDCQRVVDTVTTLRRQYPDSIAPYADQWKDVCQTFLSADVKRSSGDWQNAVKEFTKFLERYGQSPIAKLARTSLKESLLNWAQGQRQAGQYEAALKTYEMISLENADIKIQVESERTQVYLEWAQKERQAGQYEAALKVYDMIKGGGKAIRAQVARERTQVYLEWATDLKEKGEVEQAEQVLANLWNLQEIDQQQAFTVSLEWAQERRQAGRYEAALKIYDMIKGNDMTIKIRSRVSARKCIWSGRRSAVRRGSMKHP